MAPQLTESALAHRDDVLAVDLHVSGCWFDQPSQAADECRLARTGQPHDDKDLARAYLKADVTNCGRAAGLGQELGA